MPQGRARTSTFFLHRSVGLGDKWWVNKQLVAERPAACPPSHSFCAMKLAEGAIGDVNALPEGTLPAGGLPHTHPLRVVAIDANPEASTSFAQGQGQGSGQLREGGSSGGAGQGGGGQGDDPGESLSRESSGDVGAALEAGGAGGQGGGEGNGGGAGAEAHIAVQRRVNQLVTANSFGAVSGKGGRRDGVGCSGELVGVKRHLHGDQGRCCLQIEAKHCLWGRESRRYVAGQQAVRQSQSVPAAAMRTTMLCRCRGHVCTFAHPLTFTHYATFKSGLCIFCPPSGCLLRADG